MANINEARVLIIATDGVEQAELTTPRDELRKAGAQVDAATPSGEEIRGWNMVDRGDTIPADLKIDDVNRDDYSARRRRPPSRSRLHVRRAIFRASSAAMMGAHRGRSGDS